MELRAAIDAIRVAEGALTRARLDHPERGSCAIRAVIDVEIQNLRRSRQHIYAAECSIASLRAREALANNRPDGVKTGV